MLQSAIQLLQQINAWGAIQAAVTITVAWVLYKRFIDKS